MNCFKRLELRCSLLIRMLTSSLSISMSKAFRGTLSSGHSGKAGWRLSCKLSGQQWPTPSGALTVFWPKLLLKFLLSTTAELQFQKQFKFRAYSKSYCFPTQKNDAGFFVVQHGQNVPGPSGLSIRPATSEQPGAADTPGICEHPSALAHRSCVWAQSRSPLGPSEPSGSEIKRPNNAFPQFLKHTCKIQQY